MAISKQAHISWSRSIFYIAAVLFCCWALLHSGQLPAMALLWRQINPLWMFTALLLQAITYAANALILQTLLGKSAGQVSFGLLLRLSVVVLFVNQALPSGGISGNGFLYRQLTRCRIRPDKALRALTLESLCYYAALLTLLTIGYILYPATRHNVSWSIHSTLWTGYLFFVGLGIVVVLISRQSFWRWLNLRLSHYRRLRKFLHKYVYVAGLSPGNRIADLFRDKNKILIVIGLQAAIMLLDAFTCYAILQSFASPFAPGLCTFAFLLAVVIGSLPLTPALLVHTKVL